MGGGYEQLMRKLSKQDTRRLSRWSEENDANVELSEQDGVRSLHLGSDLIQSAMRISRPNDLEIVYTQCMMGFLLFEPNPKDVLMIGLGGGSLVKFVYHQFFETSITAVEINPKVVTAAQNYFFLPPEDDRFKVVLADGAEYVAQNPDSCDVLMIDGYEDGAMPRALGSRTFYEYAACALRRRGVMVVNFLGRDRLLNVYIDRIKECSPGGVLRMDDGDHGNVIVFGFQKAPDKRRMKALAKRAKELEDLYGLPFPLYVKELGF